MKKYKILFVDDDELLLITTPFTLKPIASKLQLASSGQECLDILNKDQDYDVVLLDFMMPGLDGLEVLERIRSNKKTKDLPLLIQTGMISLNKRKIYELNADVIHKPFSVDMLYQAIKKLVEN
jgi:two-component system chemotaxis sensor kinase CheA